MWYPRDHILYYSIYIKFYKRHIIINNISGDLGLGAMNLLQRDKRGSSEVDENIMDTASQW